MRCRRELSMDDLEEVRKETGCENSLGQSEGKVILVTSTSVLTTAFDFRCSQAF